MSIKNIVLAKLLDTGTVSGNQLAADLGVSRNAIWKAIKQLQDEGCTIEAATNRGYHLLSVGNTISEPVIRKYLKSAAPYSFAIFEMLDSTNIKAKELAISGEMCIRDRCMDFGNYAAANAHRGGTSLLRAVFAGGSQHPGSCFDRRRQAYEIMGRAGLLQPGAEFKKSSQSSAYILRLSLIHILPAARAELKC